MKSHYSILRFINNPLSRENIAIGLITISENKVRFKFSNEKVNLIKKLNPASFDLTNFTLNKIQNSINSANINEGELIGNENIFSIEYIERLSSYNNGILQFDKPSAINMDFNQTFFDSFFLKYIELESKQFKKEVKPVSLFKDRIRTKLYRPLENQIDVNLKIRKKQIPSLYFDYHLDGLGVNGVVSSIKGIDLNSNQSPSVIAKDISEFESFNQRLDSFSQSKGLPKGNKHYLVIDPYRGSKLSYLDLYSILSESDKDLPFYELISSEDLNRLVLQLKNDKTRKFTEEFF
jgi:hypothetical protein